MYRASISLVLALTVFVGVLATSPVSSIAQSSTPAPATPLPPPSEICDDEEFSGWEYVSEVPDGWSEWSVEPVAVADGQAREMYLVIITLGPGKCIPYNTPANQKDGAVLLILQEGVIEYTAEENAAAPGAQVLFGNLDGAGDTPGTALAFGTTQVLDEPGEWISQDDLVWFTFKNPGPWNAVIWKVVWATRPPELGCGGDCK